MQISLFDIYTGISTSIEEKKPELITLIDENIDFDALIPHRFYRAFYNHCDRKHKYHLVSFVKALVLEKPLGLCDSQLINYKIDRYMIQQQSMFVKRFEKKI